jgi:hypothetical protein
VKRQRCAFERCCGGVGARLVGHFIAGRMRRACHYAVVIGVRWGGGMVVGRVGRRSSSRRVRASCRTAAVQSGDRSSERVTDTRQACNRETRKTNISNHKR